MDTMDGGDMKRNALPIDPIENLAALVRCPSVTPAEGGALSVLSDMLAPMGFAIDRPVFSQDGTPDIENLYARKSGNGPHLMFAGHTDVVPVGDAGAWSHPPFSATLADGRLFGRGAVDMKGGIACFIAALARLVDTGWTVPGSISLLITGDEEGPAINGSVKLLAWAAERGETWDGCILGEPTNPDAMGDMIKIGRRGSLSGEITVHGTQGHAAYPHLADNPVRGIVALTDALMHPALDAGTKNFQPTNLEVTTIDVGNTATNVIAATARAAFNVRFNDTWSVETLKAELVARLDRAANDMRLRTNNTNTVRYDIVWKEPASHVFLTRDDALIDTLSQSVETVTGRRPSLSTGGGTSDARFIKDYCPVVEFGPINQTIHQANENIPVADLELLTRVYRRMLDDWFAEVAA